MTDATVYSSKLLNKRVLVVGGSSGLGFAAASAALESGAHVLLASSRQSRLDSALARLRAAYPSRTGSLLPAIQVDLATDATLESEIQRLLDAATAAGAHKLDHVLMTAGDSIAEMPLPDVTLARAKHAGNVRFFAPLLLAARLPTYINPGPESSLILTTGSVADHPIPNWSIVAGFAAGLHGLTRALALDLAPVRVNLVQPGFVDSEMWDGLETEAKAGLVRGAARYPTGRVATPVELAETYLYLMKDANATGQIVRSDSGAGLVR